MVSDDDIRKGVIALFKKYDKDNSGFIESTQLPQMCNDLMRQLKQKKNFTQQQIFGILKTIDKNQDGRVNRDQLFILMKRLNS